MSNSKGKCSFAPEELKERRFGLECGDVSGYSLNFDNAGLLWFFLAFEPPEELTGCIIASSHHFMKQRLLLWLLFYCPSAVGTS